MACRSISPSRRVRRTTIGCVRFFSAMIEDMTIRNLTFMLASRPQAPSLGQFVE
jgi:hypothetical protein